MNATGCIALTVMSLLLVVSTFTNMQQRMEYRSYEKTMDELAASQDRLVSALTNQINAQQNLITQFEKEVLK